RLARWRQGGAFVGQGAGREIAGEERGWTIVGGTGMARCPIRHDDLAIGASAPLLRAISNGGGRALWRGGRRRVCWAWRAGGGAVGGGGSGWGPWDDAAACIRDRRSG